MFKKIIFLFGLLILVFCPFAAQAQEKAEAETVNVSAQIPSPVSAENSSIQLNAQETLADPVNHPILLTVYLLDSNRKPLAGKEVLVTSNRGQVDIIEAISKLSQFKAQAASVSEIQKDKTDQNGRVSFRLTSFVPGKAILSILADGAINLEKTEINFLSLPFPANLTISVAVPFSQKEWIIFSPRLQEENLSSLQKETRTLINSGTKIKLNFWVVFLALLLIIVSPIFIVLDFINIRKLRKIERQEIELLKKIATTTTTTQLKRELKDGGFDHDGILNQHPKTPPPK